jgi:hypothetical protein
MPKRTIEGGKIYFGSCFQRVWPMIALLQNIMVPGAVMEDVLYLMVDGKQGVRRNWGPGLTVRLTPQ